MRVRAEPRRPPLLLQEHQPEHRLLTAIVPRITPTNPPNAHTPREMVTAVIILYPFSVACKCSTLSFLASPCKSSTLLVFFYFFVGPYMYISLVARYPFSSLSFAVSIDSFGAQNVPIFPRTESFFENYCGKNGIPMSLVVAK